MVAPAGVNRAWFSLAKVAKQLLGLQGGHVRERDGLGRVRLCARILTARYDGIMLSIMRTTVTLDADAERLLRNAMHARRKSFKQTLNEAIRAGLGAKSPTKSRPRFIVKARPMGLRLGIDPTSMNKLADELEVAAVVTKGHGGWRG